MKNIIGYAVAAILLCNTATAAAEVNFSAGRPEGAAATDPAVYEVLLKKTEQILTRTSAGAAGAVDVFVMRPSLTVGDKASTEGLVRNVNTLTGEFTLTAFNAIDGSTYNSVTVPLNVVAKGSGQSDALMFARSVKTTDAAFVRFIRQTRERIDAFYAEHCQEIITRAEALKAAGQPAVAQIYLLGVPASAPCAQEAISLIADCEDQMRPPTAPESPATPGADGSETPAESPAASAAPTTPTAPAAAAQPKIYVSSPALKIKLDKAWYSAGTQQIRIVMTATYSADKTAQGASVYFANALAPNGSSYESKAVVGNRFVDFPVDVPVRLEFVIEHVRSNPATLPYCEFSIGGKTVEIRDINLLQQ